MGMRMPGGLADFVDAPETEIHAMDNTLTPLVGSMARRGSYCYVPYN
jgi:hypothetical protein